MDNLSTRLEEASHAGDVNSLKELLKKDKLLLVKLIGSTSVIDNPLHIASMLGHADFVREVIYHRPELAKELNGNGLSPLHLAAAHDHVAVVKELLKGGSDICLISEKQEGLLPLQIAVKKGRTAIVKELVEACEEAVHRLTNGGETILHLAIQYNSFDTVEFLIDRMWDLNAKDNRGNTILHHSVASKNLSVIKFLLGKSAIDVNTMNLKLSTPLDVLLESRQQNGDLIIGETIRAAGGKTAAEVLSQSEPVFRDSSVSSDSKNPIPMPRTSVGQPRCLTTRNDIEETTLSDSTNPIPKPRKNDPQYLLLVATLVATVTFQAALNPPGGFNSGDDKNDGNTQAPGGFNSDDDTEYGTSNKGLPVLSGYLYYFVPFLMIALFLSVSVMMLLLCVVPRKKPIVMKLLMLVIWGATFAMGLAFTEGIYVLYYNTYYNHYKQVKMLVYGWYIVLRLAITWLLVRFLIFILKISGLWKPVGRRLASLKTGCLLKWQQFKSTSKINWSNYFELFKKLIGIVLILGALAGIITVWVFYKSTPFWEI
ncbi:uncharacterized protein LOC144566072 [Carex rostrata]